MKVLTDSAASRSSLRASQFTRAGIGCLLASIAIWGTFTLRQHRAAQAEGDRLLSSFSQQEDRTDQQAATEAQAQTSLFSTDSYTRAAFLQSGLHNAASALQLTGREQGLSVSLSQIRSSEAHFVFEQSILPSIKGATDPEVLVECFALMQRWNIADVMSNSERENLASRLVASMLQSQDTRMIDALASGVALVAPRLGSGKSNDLLLQLVTKSIQENNSGVNYARLPALIALAQGEKVDADQAKQLTTKITDRILKERDGTSLRVLALELSAMGGRGSPTTAEEIASKLMPRLAIETSPSALKSLGLCIDSLKEKIGAAKAGDLALQLAQGMTVSWNAALESIAPAWQALAGKANPEMSKELVLTLTHGMSLTPDAHTLHLMASAMAILKDKLPAGAFDPAASRLIASMKIESAPGALAELASAVGALRAKCAPERIEEAAAILIGRIEKTRDAEVIDPLATALDDLDEGLSKESATKFATILAARMRAEPDPTALLSLAVGFVALAEQVEDDDAPALIAPLLVRMHEEFRPGALRTLAFSLGALSENLSPAQAGTAGAKLAAAMSGEIDPAALRGLVAGLHALKGKAGDANVQKAASFILARIKVETDPSILRNLVSSLPALDDAQPHVFTETGCRLVDLMMDAKNGVDIRALGQSLQFIAHNLNGSSASELAARLVSRARTEHDADSLRAYGEALGSLPAGAISFAQAESLASLFAIPNAPCQIVTLVGDRQVGEQPVEGQQRLGLLVRQILNPLCSEAGWTQVVVTLDGLTKRSIVHGMKAGTGDDADADLQNLVVADDEDESSADANTSTQGNGIQVDFNKLSEVVANMRPGEAISYAAFVSHVAALLFLLAGIVLFFLAWRMRTTAVL